jgi:hypothetical protein
MSKVLVTLGPSPVMPVLLPQFWLQAVEVKKRNAINVKMEELVDFIVQEFYDLSKKDTFKIQWLSFAKKKPMRNDNAWTFCHSFELYHGVFFGRTLIIPFPPECWR